MSLSGTVSRHGVHVRIAWTDRDGQVIGGHRMDGSQIYTTAVIVIGVLDNTVFRQELTPNTSYQELEILV